MPFLVKIVSRISLSDTQKITVLKCTEFLQKNYFWESFPENAVKVVKWTWSGHQSIKSIKGVSSFLISNKRVIYEYKVSQTLTLHDILWHFCYPNNIKFLLLVIQTNFCHTKKSFSNNGKKLTFSETTRHSLRTFTRPSSSCGVMPRWWGPWGPTDMSALLGTSRRRLV